MILALDAGNSRIKWGMWQDRGFIAQGSIATRDAAGLFDVLHVHAQPDAVIGSNVAGADVAANVERALQPCKRPVRWIASQAAQCGVASHYAAPEKLGTDRWAALIGAHRRGLGASIVVDAGTAVTIDALTAQGEFLGGLIVPGIELMAQALARGTAGLPLEQGGYEDFPRTTANAIHSGAVQAIVGAIERVAHALQARVHAEASVILCGGAAPALAPRLAQPSVLAPALVLEGLVEIARE